MKDIVSISLGSSKHDYAFETEFLCQNFMIRRFGTDGDLEKARELLERWEDHADIMGLGGLRTPNDLGPERLDNKLFEKIDYLTKGIKTPVVTGNELRKVTHEWSLRHIQFKMGNNFFDNTRVFFLSGFSHFRIAKVMSEYTENLSFADLIIKNGVSKTINSIKDMERYANGIHEAVGWVPGKRIRTSSIPLKAWNNYIIRKSMQKANVIVVPHHNFYKNIEQCGIEELGGKVVITSTVHEDKVKFLKERGVNVIIDTTPKILEKVVGLNVLEALINSALDKPPEEVTRDDLLEIISEQRMDPRVVYPSGNEKRINRFSFVIHPLAQEHLKKDKAVGFVSKIAPPAFLDTIEKVVAYAPPWVYSKVTGIKSPDGTEVEGWLISVGGTPKQMLSHSPEFTYKRLLQAAKMSKRMGAQIMGLGAFTKVVGDAGVTVAKLADIPITTGNSYSASGALWAAADAVRRMGLLHVEKGKKIKAKTMVVGATGAIGSVCCRLLAKAFEELYLVDIRDARLLALKQSIEEEDPDVKVHISTRADKYIADMDVIVTATSGAGKKVIDIMQVKPGCVITDVARPLDLSAEDVAKRPDVLVIESGEIELPGNPEMKDIGLPHKVVYACLAETIVLALEGRYETFTIGRSIEWEKVREIYRMGLKHGMKLAAISGVNGVYSDEDIARVRNLAIEARKEQGLDMEEDKRKCA